jgi:major membrane immunogen (membrane-anchored lipoprotein)
MKITLNIIILILLTGCSSSKKISHGIVDQGNSAYVEMKELIFNNKVDTNGLKSVKIYSFNFYENGNPKDSSLIAYEDLQQKLKRHTIYEIKYDSLDRYSERYATRIAENETYLNDRKIYDSNSNEIEWISYNRDGKIHSKTFYYYDKDNRLIKSEKYYGYFLYDQPVLQKRKTFEYIGDILIKEIEHQLDVDYKITKTFNTKGQQIKYRWDSFENDSIVSFWGSSSVYENNRLINVQYYNSDKRNSLTKYKYNRRNLPSEILTVDMTINKPIELIKYYYYKNKKTTYNTVYN